MARLLVERDLQRLCVYDGDIATAKELVCVRDGHLHEEMTRDGS